MTEARSEVREGSGGAQSGVYPKTITKRNMKITQEEAYAILELPSGADEAQVKKAFRQLALRLHPDKNGGCLESAEQFKRVSAAYARLTLGHQSEDELDEDAFESFDDDFFEQLFGDSGLQFAFL